MMLLYTYYYLGPGAHLGKDLQPFVFPLIRNKYLITLKTPHKQLFSKLLGAFKSCAKKKNTLYFPVNMVIKN